MPLVNLIQEQRLSSRRKEAQARIAFLGFVGSSVAAVGAYGFLLYLGSATAGTEARLRADRQRLEPTVQHIEDEQKEIQALSPRLKTLEDAQQTSSRWAQILQHLTVQTPKDVWLTSLRSTVTDPTKPVTLSLQGIGMSQAPIAEFMLRVQNEKDLQNVNLRYTQEKMVLNNHTVEFAVDADVNGTAEEKPKEKKDDSGVKV